MNPRSYVTHEADVIGDRAHFAQLDNARYQEIPAERGRRGNVAEASMRAAFVSEVACPMADRHAGIRINGIWRAPICENYALPAPIGSADVTSRGANVMIQWCVKGMSLPGDAEARHIIDAHEGTLCTWWHNVGSITNCLASSQPVSLQGRDYYTRS